MTIDIFTIATTTHHALTKAIELINMGYNGTVILDNRYCAGAVDPELLGRESRDMGITNLPMSPEDARTLLGPEDEVHQVDTLQAIVIVDKHHYMEAYARGRHLDIVHDLAFTFGRADSATGHAEIVGVQEENFVVAYEAVVRDALPKEEPAAG